jgi:hypothetical protein
MSSIWGEMDNWDADKGNDGDADSNMYHNHCFMTDKHVNPWWEVDLLDVYYITQVNITNRADCCSMLLSSFLPHTHARTHTRARAHTHTLAHAHAHTHTHTQTNKHTHIIPNRR